MPLSTGILATLVSKGLLSPQQAQAAASVQPAPAPNFTPAPPPGPLVSMEPPPSPPPAPPAPAPDFRGRTAGVTAGTPSPPSAAPPPAPYTIARGRAAGVAGRVQPPAPAPAAAPAPTDQGPPQGVFAPPPADPNAPMAGASPAAVVPAQAVSTVSPETRKLAEGAQAEERAAAVEGQGSEVGANEAGVKAIEGLPALLKKQADDWEANEDVRRRQTADQMADYQKIRREADAGVIKPEHVGIAGAIGIGLSAWGGGPNAALQMIQSRISNDIAAQRANLENKRDASKEALDGLGQMRQRFGDDRIAETAESAKQLEQYKAVGNVLVARAQSPMLKAKWDGTIAGIDQAQARLHQSMEQWQQARVVGGATDANVAALAAKYLGSGTYKSPDDATEAARRVLTSGRAGSNLERVLKAGGAGASRLRGKLPELAEHDKTAQELDALVQRGSSVNPTDRARADTLAHQLITAGYQVPEHPLAMTNLNASTRAQLAAVRGMIKARRVSTQQQIDAGGGGGGAEGETEEPDADSFIKPAGQ